MAKEEKKVLIPGRPKKRLFIGMLFLASVLLAGVLYGIWYVGVPGLHGISPWLPDVLGVLLTLLILFSFFGIANMAAAAGGLPYINILQKQTYELINVLFPIAVYLGKIFGIKRRTLEGSFIAVSNLLFQRRQLRIPADRLLVVTPHCLQLATCPHKITRDPHNCKQCGGCDVGDLVALADELGFHFFVATGGTLARQIVKNIRPKAVLAIACERDLMSGVQDVYPLPAVGVLNIRPNGPCYNTKVDVNEVRRQIELLIEPKNKEREDG